MRGASFQEKQDSSSTSSTCSSTQHNRWSSIALKVCSLLSPGVYLKSRILSITTQRAVSKVASTIAWRPSAYIRLLLKQTVGWFQTAPDSQWYYAMFHCV
jgi:hypothetical protein